MFARSEDDDDYELSDRDINKLLIVTQSTSTNTSTPPATSAAITSRIPKHEGHDRTGDWTTRVKMTQDLEQAINDGLFYYEEDLWDEHGRRVRERKISFSMHLRNNRNNLNLFIFLFEDFKRLFFLILEKIRIFFSRIPGS